MATAVIVKNTGRKSVKLTSAILSHIRFKKRSGSGIQGFQGCSYCAYPPLSSPFELLSPVEAMKADDGGLFSFGSESDGKPSSNGSRTKPAQPLLDRVAIVTGASRGIGKAISLHLASLGAKLVLNYTSNASQSAAEDLASQINSTTTIHAAAFQADISDPTQVKSLFDFAEQAFGAKPHILIANAAITNPKFPTIANTEIADFDRVFSVNARGTFLCLREAANRIVRGGGGRIVTVSTSLVAAPCARSGAYTPSKAAVELMTKVVAKELRGTGITANAVAPGPIATDMFYIGKTEGRIEEVKNQSPLERLGQVDDVAPLVGFLVSDAGEWLNGQVVRVNGGFV